MDTGIFGGLFDFNRDGKMDAFEKAAECGFLHEVLMAENNDSDPDSEPLDTEDSSSDLEDEIAAAGLDRDELSWMDEDERREALEEAGLDPDDYDDLDF